MKTLLFLLLISFSLCAKEKTTMSSVINETTNSIKSGASSVVSTLDDARILMDTSSNFRMMYNDAKGAVVALASSLKVGTEYVLQIIGKKYFLEGIFSFITTFLCILLIFFAYKLGNRFHVESDGIVWIPCIVISLILCAIGYNQLQTAVMYTFNPEYYVLQEVLNMIRTWKN